MNYFGKIKCIILGCWQAGMVYSAAAGAPNPRRPTLMPIDSKTSCIQPPRFHKKSITGTFMRMQINIFHANSLVCKQMYGTVSTHVSLSDQSYISTQKSRIWKYGSENFGENSTDIILYLVKVCLLFQIWQNLLLGGLIALIEPTKLPWNPPLPEKSFRAMVSNYL